MQRFITAILLCAAMVAVASAQDVPPLPKDADALKKAGVLKDDKTADLLPLSEDLARLQERMIEVGTPKACVHNKYSFSAYISADRLGLETVNKAKAMAKTQGKEKDATELVGATFSCYKSGTHFTHVLFHYKTTSVGGPLGEPKEFTEGIVQYFLITVNDDGARRGPGTTVPGGKTK